MILSESCKRDVLRPDTKESKQCIRQEWKVLQGRLAPTPRKNIIFMNEPTMRDNQRGLKLTMVYYNTGDMQLVRFSGDKPHDYYDHSGSLRHFSKCV